MGGSRGIESSSHRVIGSSKDETRNSKLEFRSLARKPFFRVSLSALQWADDPMV
jgi:hypothetical protein